MCEAVGYIHEQNFVHRDIHPTRIHMLNDVVKINLVGLPYNFKKLIKSDKFCGHLNYSAPEMLKDKDDQLTEKVDIWALGCCLYYICTKKDPFNSSAETE